MEPYKDRDWLYYERVEQRRAYDDIARECGVSSTTIKHFAKKFGINKIKLPDISTMLIEIACHRCKTPIQKKFRYLRQRLHLGQYKFYCDSCLREVNSERFSGENNPNYGGTFHGEKPSEWSPEKWERVRAKQLETRKRNGSFVGANNPRWAGGHKTLPCAHCGKEAKARPYVYRAVKNGERNIFCSRSCSSAYKIANGLFGKDRTSIEIAMAEELDRRGINYIEQYPLSGFVLDFYLPDYQIAIECDGDYWHSLPETKKRDKAKDAYVKRLGLKMFRFSETEINESVERCVDKIITVIQERSS